MPRSEMLTNLAISLAVVLLLFLASFLILVPGFKPILNEEGVLRKNSQFSPRSGDVISYSHAFGNESETITFVFGRRIISPVNLSHPVFANCTVAAISGSNLTTCISPDGIDWNGNVSISPPFFFFSPWMLAAAENFSWDSRALNSLSREEVGSVSVRYVGKEQFRGRASYVFLVNQSGIFGQGEKKVWVDATERVLLREEGENYSIEIVSGYFLKP